MWGESGVWTLAKQRSVHLIFMLVYYQKYISTSCNQNYRDQWLNRLWWPCPLHSMLMFGSPAREDLDSSIFIKALRMETLLWSTGTQQVSILQYITPLVAHTLGRVCNTPCVYILFIYAMICCSVCPVCLLSFCSVLPWIQIKRLLSKWEVASFQGKLSNLYCTLTDDFNVYMTIITLTSKLWVDSYTVQ